MPSLQKFTPTHTQTHTKHTLTHNRLMGDAMVEICLISKLTQHSCNYIVSVSLISKSCLFVTLFFYDK